MAALLFQPLMVVMASPRVVAGAGAGAREEPVEGTGEQETTQRAKLLVVVVDPAELPVVAQAEAGAQTEPMARQEALAQELPVLQEVPVLVPAVPEQVAQEQQEPQLRPQFLPQTIPSWCSGAAGAGAGAATPVDKEELKWEATDVPVMPAGGVVLVATAAREAGAAASSLLLHRPSAFPERALSKPTALWDRQDRMAAAEGAAPALAVVVLVAVSAAEQVAQEQQAVTVAADQEAPYTSKEIPSVSVPAWSLPPAVQVLPQRRRAARLVQAAAVQAVPLPPQRLVQAAMEVSASCVWKERLPEP